MCACIYICKFTLAHAPHVHMHTYTLCIYYTRYTYTAAARWDDPTKQWDSLCSAHGQSPHASLRRLGTGRECRIVELHLHFIRALGNNWHWHQRLLLCSVCACVCLYTHIYTYIYLYIYIAVEFHLHFIRTLSNDCHWHQQLLLCSVHVCVCVCMYIHI